MFHLLKDVYVVFDDSINARLNRFVISAENGVGHAPLNTDNPDPKTLGYSISYDSIIGEGRQYATVTDFVSFLSGKCDELNSTIVVYADTDAFIKLTANWLKSITANCDSTSAFKFVEGYLSTINQSSINTNSPVKYTQVTYSNFGPVYDSATVNTAAALAFMQQNVNFLSIELLVTSYLANGSNAQVLGQRLQAMELSDIHSFMNEFKRDILDNLLNSGFTTANGLRTYTLDTLYSVVSDPALSSFWAIYNNVNDNYNNASNNWSNVTPTTVTNLYQLATNVANSVFGCSQGTSISRLNLLQYLPENPLSSTSFNTMMQFELNSPTSFRSAKYPLFNSYFVSYVVGLYKASGAGSLSAYALRG